MKCASTTVCLIFVLLSGCITKHQGPIEQSEDPFIVNQTDFKTVLSAWGNPDSIKGDVAVWHIRWSTGSKLKVAYMMIGLTLSNTEASSREYRLRFDKHGVLRDMKSLDSMSGGASWSPWPW